MIHIDDIVASRFGATRSAVVLADTRGSVVSGFYSRETGSLPVETLSGNNVKLADATSLTFDLVESAKDDPFVRLAHRHIRLSSAVINAPSDGLEIRLFGVVVSHVSSKNTGVSDPYGRVQIEVRFDRSSVRCGPPTCIDHDRSSLPVVPF